MVGQPQSRGGGRPGITPGDAEQILWRALQDLKKSFKLRRRLMRRPDGERGRHPPEPISRQPDG